MWLDCESSSGSFAGQEFDLPMVVRVWMGSGCVRVSVIVAYVYIVWVCTVHVNWAYEGSLKLYVYIYVD